MNPMRRKTHTPAASDRATTAASAGFAVVRATPLHKVGAIFGLAVLGLALSLPWWGERAGIRLTTEFLCVVALAQMWNLLAGYCGLASMGQQAFVGIGAYALVVLGLQMGVPVFWVVPLAGLAALVIAIPTALIAFRLRGAYFAIGTWVLAEVYRLVVTNLPQMSGGSGLSIAPLLRDIDPDDRLAWTLWIAVALCMASLLGTYTILRSKWGLAMTAVRDSEVASESLGISVTQVKWAVYLGAAAMTAMVGALIFTTKLRISPDAAFSMDWTALMFFSVVIGGIGTLEGPILGALVFFALREWLSDWGSQYLIILGVLTIAVILWAPGGLWGLIARRWDVQFFPVRRRVETAATGT